jgi:predicted DNA-binding protein with PD1-like motif
MTTRFSAVLPAVLNALTAIFPTVRLKRRATPAPAIHALRLHPGQDLKTELEALVRARSIAAGFIVTCVGSLQRAVLRPAGEDEPLVLEEKFEIVALTGTLSPDGVHVHIALSDRTGRTIGGHLLGGNVIYTTAEIVIGTVEHLAFKRETDERTGYKELVIH